MTADHKPQIMGGFRWDGTSAVNGAHIGEAPISSWRQAELMTAAMDRVRAIEAQSKTPGEQSKDLPKQP